MTRWEVTYRYHTMPVGEARIVDAPSPSEAMFRVLGSLDDDGLRFVSVEPYPRPDPRPAPKGFIDQVADLRAALEDAYGEGSPVWGGLREFIDAELEQSSRKVT